MAPFHLLLIVAAIALVALAAYGAYVESLRRPQQVTAVAAQLGWHFDPSDDATHSDRYAHFSPFSKGDDRRAYNLLRGAYQIAGRSWPALAGDYRYDTSRTDDDGHRHTTTHRLSFLIVETPHLGAPDLIIRREGIFDRFASFLGFDDIDFESNEFSERFLVKSSDKRFAYALIDPRMMEFLLETDPPAVEFRRGQCCFLRGESKWTGDQFLATIQWAEKFLSRWPAKLPSVLDA